LKTQLFTLKEEKMIKAIELSNQEFKDKRDLFLALKENKELIISNKKATRKNSDSVVVDYTDDTFTVKSIDGLEKGFIYPVINTTGYMDSHNDVHIKGIWNKSAREQTGKVYYVTDHKITIDTIVAYPKDVEVFVSDYNLKDLGYNSDGVVEGLTYKISEDVFKYSSPQAVKHIEQRLGFQHSVKMEYVNMHLCINSTDKEFKAEKKDYDKYISDVANIEKAEEKGFFWAVTEAKIVQEGSMLPLGSNDITPMNYGSEPSDDTQKVESEPSKGIQKSAIEEFYLGMYK